MLGNEIVVASNPRGLFLEGYISGTPKPGVMVTMKSDAPVGGRHTWEPFNRDADGKPGMVAVLLPDALRGRTYDDAYVTGERCFLYVPVNGEELNARVAVAGTASDDAIAIGDVFMIDDGTGLLRPDSSGDRKPFQALEALEDVTAEGTLCHVLFTGV